MSRPSRVAIASALISFLTSVSSQSITASSVAANSSTTPTFSSTVGASATTSNPVFTVPTSAEEGARLLPNIRDPEAVNAQEVCPGYKISHVREDDHGLTAILTLAGASCNAYGTDIETLNLTVQYQAEKRLAVNISPAKIDASNYSHYILSEDLIPRSKPDSSYRDSDLGFDWGDDPSFWFQVVRHSTGDILFDSKGTTLVYQNQFIEFVSHLPNDYNLYGLGERIHGLRLGNNFTATMYAADVGDPIDENLYGSHPFYLDTRYYVVNGNRTRKLARRSGLDPELEYESLSHGVYLRNAHGQEVILAPQSITWRTLGGSIDLYFFDGPTQAEVTSQYQQTAIGLPAMQSYWTFGFHQCRWGYTNWTHLRQVIDSFRAFDIPLETVWLDIDYMDQYRDFTLDPKQFSLSETGSFLAKLHNDSQHFVPIIDGAIYIPNPENEADAYPVYTRGNATGAFVQNPDGSEYIGAVWPGYTVFPDWLANSTVKWWIDEMMTWYKEVAFDGAWIDMSEVSSFCVGSCGSGNLTLNPVHPPFALPGEPGNVIYDYPEGFDVTNSTEAASASAASSSQAASKTSAAPTSGSSTPYLRTTPTPGVRNINHPPYVINNVQGDLAVHAMSPNATHRNGVVEYDVHNIWGHQILNATYQALLNIFPGKRPFIIGRSTFAGSGKWAGHWGGDNASKWYYMYFSIPQALSFSLFGIPMFGVDTCGFNGNTDAELCSRWMQLSAFFPFYRNHNVLSAIPQEPYVWESVATATKTAMKIRYSILPYMYTLLYQAHNTGSTVMRALAWEFPNEPWLANADRQFLLGPALMVVPVLEPLATKVQGVFPGVKDGTTWYDWYTKEKVQVKSAENKTIDAPLGHIPLFVRGGYVIPQQEPGYTTADCRKNPWSLIVALSDDGEAAGEVYIDDGESLEPTSSLLVKFKAEDGLLSTKVSGAFAEKNPLANVTIMGVQSCGGGIKFNGAKVRNGTVLCDDRTGSLTVGGLQNMTQAGAWSRNWTLTWS